MNRVNTSRHLAWELIIVLVFIAIAASVYNPTPIQPAQPNPVTTSRPLPDHLLCEKTPTGWKCVLTKDPNWNTDENAAVRFDTIREQFDATCNQQGGLFKTYGYGLPTYDHFCDFPFSDAGKSCTNSNQCAGKCIIEADQMKPIGKCATYELRTCDQYVELNDGQLTANDVICD